MRDFRTVLAVVVVVAAGNPLGAQSPFAAGNLAVLQAAASATNTTGSLLELTRAANQANPVQSIAINGTTGASSLRFSGSATSTMYLSATNDRSLLTFTGANTTNTSSNANTILSRGVGTFDAAGAYNLATTYTGATGNQIRAATSTNNSTFYIADQGGQYTNSSTTPSPSGNFRNARAFGGVVYTNTSSSSTAVIQVGTLSAASGGTYTGLTGLSNNASIQDFYLIQSGNNGSTYDVLYTLSATSNTAGVIAKYSLVAGSWVANGTTVTGGGGFGLAAEDSGDGANLYITTGLGALTGNSVLGFADAAGYNSTLSLGASTTLYAAPAGTILKGIEFTPVPEPATVLAVAAGGLALVRLRRRA